MSARGLLRGGVVEGEEEDGHYLFAYGGCCLWWQIIFISKTSTLSIFPARAGAEEAEEKGKGSRRGKRTRKHVSYKLWTLIIAYFPCLWYMQHDSNTSAGHQSTDWCGRTTITRNIHIYFRIHIPIRNRIRVANLLCLCRIFCKSDFIQIAFCTLGKKAEKSLQVCVRGCVYCMHMSVFPAPSLSYTLPLSLSLSQSLWRGLVRTQGKSLKPFIMSIMTDGLYMFTW